MREPRFYTLMAAACAVIAVLASYIPARRAGRVNPIALRRE